MMLFLVMPKGRINTVIADELTAAEASGSEVVVLTKCVRITPISVLEGLDVLPFANLTIEQAIFRSTH